MLLINIAAFYAMSGWMDFLSDVLINFLEWLCIVDYYGLNVDVFDGRSTAFRMLDTGANCRLSDLYAVRYF